MRYSTANFPASKPAHSELGPSASDKWMVCPAWRRFTQVIPKAPSGKAAEEGTEAHALLEAVLVGRIASVEHANMEMAKHVQSCADWVYAQSGIVHPEVEVDYGEEFGYVNLFGTSDIIIEHKEHLTVGDLKYGFGLVEAEDNSQMMIYLVGAVARFGEREKYRLVILQPRGNHFKGPIREVWVPHAELLVFKSKLAAAIADSYTNKPPVVGAHCRNYCAALATCSGVKEHAVRLFKSTDHG